MRIDLSDRISEALDAASNSEGTRPFSGFDSSARRSQHKRSTLRRVIIRFLAECDDDLTVAELREALE